MMIKKSIKILFFLFLTISSLEAYSVYSITDKEYEMYKKDPQKTLEYLQKKYFYKVDIKEELKIKEVQKTTKTPKKIQNNNKIVPKGIKKETNVSKKAQFNNQNDIISIKAVIQSLQYNKIMTNKDLESLIKSVNYYYKEKTVDIDPREVKLVLESIQKKKYTTFEANLYLQQLKDFLKD